MVLRLRTGNNAMANPAMLTRYISLLRTGERVESSHEHWTVTSRDRSGCRTENHCLSAQTMELACHYGCRLSTVRPEKLTSAVLVHLHHSGSMWRLGRTDRSHSPLLNHQGQRNSTTCLLPLVRQSD